MGYNETTTKETTMDENQTRSDLHTVIRAYPMLVVKALSLVIVIGACTVIGMRSGVKLALDAIHV